MFPVSRRFLVAAAAGLGVLAIGAATLLLPTTTNSNAAVASGHAPQLSVITSYKTDSAWDATGAEIVVYDAGRMYVANGDRGVVEVVDISDPANPQFLFDLDTAPFGADVTSVAVHKGLVVAVVPAEPKTDPGKAVFFNKNGTFLASVEVGALPDMVTFTPNGNWVLVANEGEPNDGYDIDPEGSVSIIRVPLTLLAAKLNRAPLPFAVRHVTFEAFNEGGPRHNELPDDIRIFGPNATVAQDLEPEYIAVSHNNRKAYVSLQENNAVAVIDVQRARVDSIFALGFKDHSLPGNEFDASDRDDAINITNWPVLGIYMPDSLAAYHVRGKTYLVTANEGDAREYDGYSEVSRLRALTGDVPLCPDVFPDAATLRDNTNLGRLNVTTANGLRSEGPNAPCYEEIYAYGARSFSIWTTDGTQLFDSGSQFENIIADVNPDFFNSNHSENNFEGRSDDKGPEPEGVITAQVKGRWYAFIGLERVGGVMVYDITNPAAPEFIQYINNRDFTAEPETGPDTGPEGLVFVDAKKSPNGKALLLVANEVSGTVSIFQFD